MNVYVMRFLKLALTFRLVNFVIGDKVWRCKFIISFAVSRGRTLDNLDAFTSFWIPFAMPTKSLNLFLGCGLWFYWRFSLLWITKSSTRARPAWSTILSGDIRLILSKVILFLLRFPLLLSFYLISTNQKDDGVRIHDVERDEYDSGKGQFNSLLSRPNHYHHA